MEDSLQSCLSEHGFAPILKRESVGGGSINEAETLTLENGQTLFLKSNSQAAADFFPAEAHGLKTLAQHTSLHIPQVIHVDHHFILLEDMGRSSGRAPFFRELGAGVAELHQSPQTSFGFDSDNYCGATRQYNPRNEDGYEFFAEQRLLKLGIQAFDKNRMPSQTMKMLEYVAANLSRWIPDQKPVLVHGDLWSGNTFCDGQGKAAMFDPACYWGWPESDLAMTHLFGGFTDDFYAAYNEIRPLESDWLERAPLYNLYHLLNHLLLFGSTYLPPIHSICERFANK